MDIEMEEFSYLGSNTAIIAATVVSVVILAWIHFVKTGPVYKGEKDLSGKTVVITGANVGVGKETAICLAKRNARVIIACRNEEKAMKALADIRLSSGSSMVHFMKVDLSDMKSVHQFVDEFIATEPKLDILINNAAASIAGRTKDGFDMMFASNLLGPFLLTYLLMPVLKRTAEHSPVRVVNVASEAYKMGKVDLDNLNPDMQKANSIQIFVQYCNTKLANIYFTNELNRRLRSGDPQSNNITTYAVHPGTINSRLGADQAEKAGLFYVFGRFMFMTLFGRSSFYGCQTTLYCCLEDGIESESGKYFTNMKAEKLLPFARDQEKEEKLWESCEKLTGLTS